MKWLKDDGFSPMSWLFVWVFFAGAIILSIVSKNLINPFSIGISAVPPVMVLARYFTKGSYKVNGPSIEINKES